MDRTLRDNLLFGLLLLIVVLIVTDCSTGKTRYCPGTVREHVYNPPYTTHSTDSKGHTSTTYHSATYHLLVECRQPDHAANVSAGMINYTLIHNGQGVIVGERLGGFSKIIWAKWIEKRQISDGAY